jgi:hypothetical protein
MRRVGVTPDFVAESYLEIGAWPGQASLGQGTALEQSRTLQHLQRPALSGARKGGIQHG